MTTFDAHTPTATYQEFFASGSTIFREGELGETLYVVLDGIVNVSVAERHIATIGPGGIIGEMAVITRQPRSATAIAEADCVLAPINAAQFQALTQQTPALVAELLDALSERLQRANIREATRDTPLEVTIRQATPDDLPATRAVVEQSLRILGAADYSPRQIESALNYIAGTDTPNLIADGTYYVAEAQGNIAGCGGWSKRHALHGGHGDTNDAVPPPLDPARDAAKIRQFYVHPRWAKRGIARRLLHACEDAARVAGFTRLELAATLTGEPLYGAHGFKRVEPMEIMLPDGVALPVIKMVKQLDRSR